MKRKMGMAKTTPKLSIQMPDFLSRLKIIYKKKTAKVVGAELISRDRDRY